MPKKHPFGPSAQRSDAGVMPPRPNKNPAPVQPVEVDPPIVEVVPEVAQQDEPPKPPELALEDMTRGSLLAQARSLGLEVTTRNTKEELIAALTAADTDE